MGKKQYLANVGVLYCSGDRWIKNVTPTINNHTHSVNNTTFVCMLSLRIIFQAYAMRLIAYTTHPYFKASNSSRKLENSISSVVYLTQICCSSENKFIPSCTKQHEEKNLKWNWIRCHCRHHRSFVMITCNTTFRYKIILNALASSVFCKALDLFSFHQIRE